MARPNRIKLSGEGYYHVIDRVAHREFLLRDERIKRRLVDLMHRAAAFSGVDVCTYVVMDNHLHLWWEYPIPVTNSQLSIGNILTLATIIFAPLFVQTIELALLWQELRLCLSVNGTFGINIGV